MSSAGRSPHRPSRKRAEIVEFFRGSSSSHPPSPKKETQSAESSDCRHTNSSTTLKRVATKIPFLGRTRKKSTPSIKSGYLSSDALRGYDSSDVASDPPTSKKNRRLSQPLSLPKPALPHPPLPKPSDVQPRPSFSSKFAAQLGAKSRWPALPRTPSPSHLDGSLSDTVAVPRSRRLSMDSDSTTTSDQGRLTPRGRPTITVSLSPDGLDDYKDLFTLPRSKTTPPKRVPTTPASEYRDLYHDGASAVTLTQSASHPRDLPLESMSEIARREARQLAEGHISSPFSTVAPMKKRPSSLKPPETDDSASEREYTNSPLSVDWQSKFSSLPRSGRSSRLRSAATKERSQPPSIPLPPPPTGTPPLPPSLPSYPSPASSPRPSPVAPFNNAGIRMRPRANTLGSLPPSPKSRPHSPAPCHEKDLPVPATDLVAIKHDEREHSDIDAMSSEQLKQALRARNDQYDELAMHFLEVTKTHATEIGTLGKKIHALEMEVSRKDKEIQGFTWMLNARGLSADIMSLTAPADGTLDASQPICRTRSSASSRRSSRMVQGTAQDDSGAESNPTSGAESILNSDSSLSVHKDKLRRSRILGDINHTSFRSSTLSSKSSGLGALVLDGPASSELPNGQRSAVYTYPSSASSSSSSLLPLPPTPSSPATVLTAIPETGAVPIAVTENVLPPEDEANRRSTSRSSRMSTASSVSATVAASSAYSANLRRSRPPSIAQVLEKSTPMEDVKKLQPLAGTTTAVVTPAP